jgi:hypothetical protein
MNAIVLFNRKQRRQRDDGCTPIHVWEAMSSIAYQSLGDDTAKWDREKIRRYSEQNCMIIR